MKLMRKFQITLFIIAMVFASTQTFRHVYVKWIQPKNSVLDRYDENIEKSIAESKSLNELLILYDQSKEEIKKYESNNTNPEIKENEKRSKEPYKTEITIKNSIEKWESHENQIRKLRFFWVCGILSVILGFIVYHYFDQWLGMVGIITGFSEMIFWTCPTIIGFFGSRFEFERLLNNKLGFAIVTWFMMILSWFLLYKIEGKTKKNI
jgi:hypothetical protein